jgi:hypothetical protein
LLKKIIPSKAQLNALEKCSVKKLISKKTKNPPLAPPGRGTPNFQ